MAARFAVTTGNWTGAIWAATSGGAAGSAAVPTTADDATINKNVVVTLDATTCVARSLDMSVGTTGSDVGGKLLASTTANSKLVVEYGIVGLGSTGGTSGSYSSTVELDMSGASAYTCEIRLNNANGSGTSMTVATTTSYMALNGRFTLKGAARTRWTTTTGALTGGTSTSCTVSNASGWAVGDRLVFISTQAYNATPRTDVVTIATVDTGTGAITWTDGTGAGGSVAYNHATACVVGNFTSNLKIGPATAAQNGGVNYQGGATQNGTSYCEHVLFDGVKVPDAFRGAFGAFNVSGSGVTIKNNAFYDYTGFGLCLNGLSGATGTRENNIFYTTRANATAIAGANVGTADTGNENTFVIFRSATGINSAASGCKWVGGYISGCTTSADSSGTVNARYEDCHVFGNANVKSVPNASTAPFQYLRTSIGTKYSGAVNANVAAFTGPAPIVLEDCPLDITGGTIATTLTSCGTSTYLQLLNKGDGTQTGISAAVQEVYRSTSNSAPVLSRDASVATRSTSSLLMDFIGTGNIAQSWTASIPAKSGAALKVLLYVRKNSSYGASTLPSATLSGLGITPVTATMSGGTAADTWELLDLSYASGAAPSADGNLTLTLTAQSATNGAKAYFSAVPLAPFITRVRHYGYLFDETTPTRTVNPTISASEATAIAYTGMTVTWGSSSSTSITLDTTFQKLYDYTQADACLNVGSAMPLTGAGIAGNPALFAAGNVTISTTKVLNGSGSISMGAYTLTTETASAQSYTYTGGTWSQLTTVPTVNGGTMALSGEGTWTFTVAGSTILTFAPTASAVTYVMGGSTISGTLDLRNTHGTRTITVELPSGASYTTANNTGAAITVTTPQLYQSVTITGATAGSRIQIYDTTSSTELYNGTPSFPYTWTDGTPAAGDRAIRLKVAYVSGVTAKTFIEASIGTCGTSSGDKDISYLVNQTNDATYNANALNGETIYNAGEITFTDSSPDVVNIDVAANTVSLKSIYAAWCWYAFTSAGIATDIDYISATDTANYILSNMKIKNTSSPTAPLEVTGGYAVDSTTGASIDLADTTGGTLIFAPDHVVAYATGSGPLTAGQAIELTAAASAAAAAAASTANLTYSGTAVKADIQKVLGTVIQTGSTSNASIGY